MRKAFVFENLHKPKKRDSPAIQYLMGGRKLLVYVCDAVATIFDNREFKIPQRRRGRKRDLKSDFAFFKTSVRLSQHAHFVLCPGFEFLRKKYSSLKPERKRNCRRMFTLPMIREIRQLTS